MPLTGAASDISFKERLAARRAEVGDSLLVSRLDEPAPIPLGALVWQKSDPLASHEPVHGRVAERYVNEDGEPGVVLVELWRREVRVHRLLVADCVTEPSRIDPPAPVPNANVARGIFACVGAGSSCLTDREHRLLHLAARLLHADVPAPISTAAPDRPCVMCGDRHPDLDNECRCACHTVPIPA